MTVPLKSEIRGWGLEGFIFLRNGWRWFVVGFIVWKSDTPGKEENDKSVREIIGEEWSVKVE